MQLTCPKCSARYRVAAELIPTAGRDVQCSNCGRIWFQQPRNPESDAPDPAGAEADDAVTAPSATDARAEPGDEDRGVAAPAADRPADAGEAGPQGDGPEVVPLPRRDLDPGVRAVLREEAAREAQARRSESRTAPRVQPDLGLVTPPPAAGPAARGAAVAPPETIPGETTAAPTRRPRSRRESSLPDAEGISSTLRSTSAPRGPAARAGRGAEMAEARERARRRGFRRGFLPIVGLVAAGICVYLLAPVIVARLPQSEPVMVAYVDWANDLRGWLSTQVAELADRVAATGV